jgi:hypothetical protein
MDGGVQKQLMMDSDNKEKEDDAGGSESEEDTDDQKLKNNNEMNNNKGNSSSNSRTVSSSNINSRSRRRRKEKIRKRMVSHIPWLPSLHVKTPHTNINSLAFKGETLVTGGSGALNDVLVWNVREERRPGIANSNKKGKKVVVVPEEGEEEEEEKSKEVVDLNEFGGDVFVTDMVKKKKKIDLNKMNDEPTKINYGLENPFDCSSGSLIDEEVVNDDVFSLARERRSSLLNFVELESSSFDNPKTTTEEEEDNSPRLTLTSQDIKIPVSLFPNDESSSLSPTITDRFSSLPLPLPGPLFTPPRKRSPPPPPPSALALPRPVEHSLTRTELDKRSPPPALTLPHPVEHSLTRTELEGIVGKDDSFLCDPLVRVQPKKGVSIKTVVTAIPFPNTSGTKVKNEMDNHTNNNNNIVSSKLKGKNKQQRNRNPKGGGGGDEDFALVGSRIRNTRRNNKNKNRKVLTNPFSFDLVGEYQDPYSQVFDENDINFDVEDDDFEGGGGGGANDDMENGGSSDREHNDEMNQSLKDSPSSNSSASFVNKTPDSFGPRSRCSSCSSSASQAPDVLSQKSWPLLCNDNNTVRMCPNRSAPSVSSASSSSSSSSFSTSSFSSSGSSSSSSCFSTSSFSTSGSSSTPSSSSSSSSFSPSSFSSPNSSSSSSSSSFPPSCCSSPSVMSPVHYRYEYPRQMCQLTTRLHGGHTDYVYSVSIPQDVRFLRLFSFSFFF